ncbi:MAG: hypothetical protein JSW16_03995 [Dehalococcoidales bacterium]|nr:MAG: hypothetical protein JSW16_03995 [Dehalococcoidales bacterium]
MRRLAVVQVVLGALIIGALVWFIGWVEYDYGSFTEIVDNPAGGGTVEVEMNPVPGWVIKMVTWKAAGFVLGISVLGCGLAQWVRAREVTK